MCLLQTTIDFGKSWEMDIVERLLWTKLFGEDSGSRGKASKVDRASYVCLRCPTFSTRGASNFAKFLLSDRNVWNLEKLCSVQ